MMRILLASSLTLATLSLTPLIGAYDACEQIPNGRACGEVALVGCSTGVGEGEATREVLWELRVITNHGNAYDSSYGYAAALAADAPCWTDTCARAELWADGVKIDSTITQCISI